MTNLSANEKVLTENARKEKKWRRGQTDGYRTGHTPRITFSWKMYTHVHILNV